MSRRSPLPDRDAAKEDDEEEEEDYLTMSIPDPGPTKRPGSLTHQEKQQRKERQIQDERSRKERDQEKIKVSLFQEEDTKKSRAFQMMKKMGYSVGSTLGSSDHSGYGGHDSRSTEPIMMDLKVGRGGIGYDSAVKRKATEQLESARNKTLTERENYASFQRQQFETRKIESRLRAAQHMSEEFDENRRESEFKAQHSSSSGKTFPDVDTLPLRSINVLWRRLVIDKREQRLEQIRKKEALESLSHIRSRDAHPDLQERELERDPIQADNGATTVSKNRMKRREEEETDIAKVEQDDDMESDPELEQFENLSVNEQLEKVLNYLRDKYHYCFWCSCQYSDAQDMNDSCPGLTEADHD